MHNLIEFAEIDANTLHSRLQLQGPPYNPFETAELLGIRIDEQLTLDLINKSGKITQDESGQIVMWVNPNEVSYRRRFTAAHELGHLIHDLLPKLKDHQKIEDCIDGADYYRDGRTDPKEKRANIFAARFLMPAEDIIRESKDFLQKHQGSSNQKKVDLVFHLADLFKVSKQSIEIRLRDLGIRI